MRVEDGATTASLIPAVQPAVHAGMNAVEAVVVLASHLKLLLVGTLIAGLLAVGVAYLLPPIFTARSSFLPPQQQPNPAVSTIASIGALAGIAGASNALKSPADQYVALMQSVTVQNHIIDRFQLLAEYELKYRVDARKRLTKNSRFTVGKKDNVIEVEVDDREPVRAAAIANAYIEELRRLTSTLALTEAQQRRMFFENQLRQTKDKLTQAQQALQASGLSQGALKAEPKEAAEGYARLKAQVTAAEVRLQTLRGMLADSAPEIVQQQSALSALRQQLAALERTADVQGGPDYISKYRDFKYQETLFELFARQYELARVDESREGALLQVIDPATPPEKRSKPRRLLLVLGGTAAGTVALIAFVLLRHQWRRRLSEDPSIAASVAKLGATLRGRA